jgi:hypothetical protein
MARDAGSGAAVRSAETRGGTPEGRGGTPHELPPEERLSIMSTRAAHKSSTIRAAEGLIKCSFAAFVDNVDTRAQRQIQMSTITLSFWIILPPGPFLRAAEAGHHRCHRQYRQSPILAVPGKTNLLDYIPNLV